jgi:hypothetical protein
MAPYQHRSASVSSDSRSFSTTAAVDRMMNPLRPPMMMMDDGFLHQRQSPFEMDTSPHQGRFDVDSAYSFAHGSIRPDYLNPGVPSAAFLSPGMRSRSVGAGYDSELYAGSEMHSGYEETVRR